MHGEKEYKLGTHSQVSIVSSYIREVHSSNYPRYHLVDHVAWNTMSHLVEKPHLVTWKCHVSLCGNNIFHWHFTCEIPGVAMHVEMKL